MPERWLQVKGDPSVREFLFAQERKTSMFDSELDRVHELVRQLLTRKGAFHVKIHYSSSQLTVWFHDNPYHYRVYVRDEVLDSGFLDSLPNISYEGRGPAIAKERLDVILAEFKRLRFADDQVYLRNASINRINGMIGMTFSCDGSHYIDCDEFFEKIHIFGTVQSPCVAE